MDSSSQSLNASSTFGITPLTKLNVYQEGQERRSGEGKWEGEVNGGDGTGGEGDEVGENDG